MMAIGQQVNSPAAGARSAGRLDTRGAGIALVIGHMAGMIDIPALPIWVGTLIAGYGMQPAQAGGLATLFLAGVVISSVALSHRFHRMPGRWMPTIGFAVASASFFAMTGLASFGAFAVAHLVAGLANGLAISFVHGTMGRRASPHRIFALGSLALGLLAVVFFGGAPVLIAKFGRETLFVILGAAMAIGAVVTALMFPAASENEDVIADQARFTRKVWFAILGIMCMALNQAMVFSFVERVGVHRGFSPDQIRLALVLSGALAILPAILATVLEKRLPAVGVAVAGAAAQGICALILSHGAGYDLYLAGMVLFPFIMLFTHTFVFGHLARIEPSGRANAATPAMIMTGSATGPLLGGVLVQTAGYNALGLAAGGIAALALVAYTQSRAGERA